jgi:energy-coupling factor transport system permease protein
MKPKRIGNALHPVTWWTLAFIAVAIAVISHSLTPLLIIGASSLVSVVVLERDWAKSIKLYAGLATLVFVTRLFFRVLFNFSTDGRAIALNLPLLEIDLGIGAPVHLLGPLSQSAINAAVVDGLRLAVIILAIGVTSTLAKPSQLLKYTPAAVYEIATAVTIAINLAPQLSMSIQRVKRAGALRGRSEGLGLIRSLIIPVLEDSIENSMNLAASMAARGFGRTVRHSIVANRLLKAFSLVAAGSTIITAYLILTLGLFNGASIATLILSLVSSVLALKISSSQKIRTSLNRKKLGAIDALVLLAGLVIFYAVSRGWIA